MAYGGPHENPENKITLDLQKWVYQIKVVEDLPFSCDNSACETNETNWQFSVTFVGWWKCGPYQRLQSRDLKLIRDFVHNREFLEGYNPQENEHSHGKSTMLILFNNQKTEGIFQTHVMEDILHDFYKTLYVMGWTTNLNWLTTNLNWCRISSINNQPHIHLILWVFIGVYPL